VVALCRRASRIHFELILMPTFVVRARLFQSANGFYRQNIAIWKQRIFALGLLIFVAFLPAIYGQFFMDNPCEDGLAKKGKKGGIQKLAAIGPHEIGGGAANDDSRCSLQEDLQHFESQLFLGCVFVSGPVILVLGAALLTLLFQTAHTSGAKAVGYCNALSYKRLMWKPLLFLWYRYTNAKMDRVRYSNENNLIGGLYTTPSVVVCMMQIIIVTQMLFMGIWYGNRIAGAVCAVGMLKVFHLIGNTLFGGNCLVVNFTQNALKKWKYRGQVKIPDQSVVLKLQRAAKAKARSLSLTYTDLIQLTELRIHHSWLHDDRGLDKDREDKDRVDSEGTIDDIGVFTEVYLEDSRQVVDLVSGKVRRSDEAPPWQVALEKIALELEP